VRRHGAGKGTHGDSQSGDELGVAVDYREYVQAFIKSDGSGVEEAIWVRQPHLARQVCYLFQSDFTLTKVRAMVQAGKEVKEIGREMTRLTRMAEVQALPELLPQEWVLTDARKGIQKRRKALAAGTQPEPGQLSSQVRKVTLREIEYIMVVTSRTVVMESADLAQPSKPPPDKTKQLPWTRTRTSNRSTDVDVDLPNRQGLQSPGLMLTTQLDRESR